MLAALALSLALASAQPWPDADREIEAAAEGMLDVCETLATPLGLIPGVGEVVGVAAGWLCIVPAALAVDYVAVHHGGRESFLWQALISITAAKVVGVVVELPVLAVGVGAVALYGVAAAGLVAASGTTAFVPLAVGGGILLGYVAFEAWRTAHDRVPGAVFSGIYGLVARPFDDDGQARRAQQAALVKPHVDGIPGFLALVAGASVMDVQTEWLHLAPVVGPFAKARARADLAKGRMRRVGRDVIGDPPKDLSTMDAIEDVLSQSKAWMQAGGHVLLIGGLGTAGIGAAVAAATLAGGERPPPVDVLGVVGVSAMGAGVGALLLSKATDVARPIALPVAYVLAPPLASDAE